MGSLLIRENAAAAKETHAQLQAFRRVALQDWSLEGLLLGLAMGVVPFSIAVTETLLTLACITRALSWKRGRTFVAPPRVFWLWLIWAGLEVLSWALSPERALGRNEIRRLFLIGSLFFVLPSLDRADHRLTVWKGIFVSSTLGSLFLLGDFFARFIQYRKEVAVGENVSLYLRTGGLLNNWMVYATVEILVVAGLISFMLHYPEEKRRWWLVAAINLLAIVFSLTRALWIASFLLLTIALAWRRSKWIWALPLLPICLFILVPSAVRSRVKESMQTDYYSNAERIQMLRVGWRMVKEKPIVGVGPGRVQKLYQKYLSPGDPVPAYHGHLHNNIVQLAAEFGLPVALAAFLFVVFLFRDLLQAWKASASTDSQFAAQAGILGLIGFLVVGLFDYSYGHSLGLILLAFVVLSPLLPTSSTPSVASG